MSLVQQIKRLLLQIIIAGSVLWTFFSLIAGGFVILASRNPPYGDNTGLGILCLSIPLSLISAIIILYSFKREFMK